MMNYQEKLEELLNELIKKGRKPRGREDNKDIRILTGKYTSIRIGTNFIDGVLVRSINDLCSIDSGLRQFVCNKELYNDDDFEGVIKVSNKKYKYDEEDNGMFFNDEFEYRLMLSSIQEEKEKFILENIVIK